MEQVATSRSEQLDDVLHQLLRQSPEIEAAAVVSFDGLPMASALPRDMDEDRVAAMSAALLSLGERAAVGLGRGELQQVYIEGENGTVFLVSADNEAVLVAVAAAGAKVGMMLYEVRRGAATVADVLRLAEPRQPEHQQVENQRAEPQPTPAEPAAAVEPAAVDPYAPDRNAPDLYTADTAAADVYVPVGYATEYVPRSFSADILTAPLAPRDLPVAPATTGTQHTPELQPEVVAAVSGTGNGWSSYRPDGTTTPGQPHTWS